MVRVEDADRQEVRRQSPAYVGEGLVPAWTGERIATHMHSVA